MGPVARAWGMNCNEWVKFELFLLNPVAKAGE